MILFTFACLYFLCVSQLLFTLSLDYHWYRSWKLIVICISGLGDQITNKYQTNTVTSSKYATNKQHWSLKYPTHPTHPTPRVGGSLLVGCGGVSEAQVLLIRFIFGAWIRSPYLCVSCASFVHSMFVNFRPSFTVAKWRIPDFQP